MLTGIRALKGWWTCDENLWPTDVDLSVTEFEDWRSIPPEAWEGAKQQRVKNNKAIVASWPGVIESFKVNGGDFAVIVQHSQFLGETQFDLRVIDQAFDDTGWAQFRVHDASKRLELEDLFVKAEFRRLGIGSWLVRRIEKVFWDSKLREINEKILVPIPKVDIWLADRYEVVKAFFEKNGYRWEPSTPSRGEISDFIASKKLHFPK